MQKVTRKEMFLNESHWADGTKLTKTEKKLTKLVRAAGCKCKWPILLGYIPGKARCRMCGIMAETNLYEQRGKNASNEQST